MPSRYRKNHENAIVQVSLVSSSTCWLTMEKRCLHVSIGNKMILKCQKWPNPLSLASYDIFRGKKL